MSIAILFASRYGEGLPTVRIRLLSACVCREAEACLGSVKHWVRGIFSKVSSCIGASQTINIMCVGDAQAGQR
jgi:hypothetical protein